jgi:hypothetical protein
MKDVGKINGKLVHFTAIWYHLVYVMVICYILWSFDIFFGHLLYFVVILLYVSRFGIFFPFWYVVPRKIWQPWFQPRRLDDNAKKYLWKTLFENSLGLSIATMGLSKDKIDKKETAEENCRTQKYVYLKKL